jgi:serine/threonine protein kinase
MGEVYQARDTKLGRDVAIKILPAALASDSERLGRFEREAKTVAGVGNVWSMPLGGGEPVQLTHFEEAGNSIGGLVMSPDGKTLVVGAGRSTQDIVLLENFR